MHGWCVGVLGVHDRGDAGGEEGHAASEVLALELVLLAHSGPVRMGEGSVRWREVRKVVALGKQ